MKFLLIILLSVNVFAADENVEVVKIEPRQRQYISTGAHIGGAVASYFLGFGSGQGIQGTWDERGQKFTYGELFGLGATMTGLLMCEKNQGNTFFPSITCPGISGVLAGGGFVAMIVFRVWGVYDAIIYPFQNNRLYEEQQNKTSFYIDPVQKQVGLVFQF